MKKLYYLLASMAVILMLARCETINMDDEMDAINPDKNEINKGINYNVSLKSAKYLIQSTEKDKTIKNIEPLVTGKDTLMFIFNFDNGWQVVSGDKRTEPILASDKDGKLSIEKLSNPGVATWLSDKADKILYLKKNNPKIDYNENIELWVLIDKAAHFTKENLEKYNTKYSAISSEKTKQVKKRPLPDGSYRWIKRLVSVTSTPWNVSSQKGPLLKTKWGQGNPWNTDVPYALINDNKWIKCPTGCTAVAMAQIIYNMHYRINKPKGLFHTVSCTGKIWDSKNYRVSFSRGSYVANSNRWDLMKKNKYSIGNASYVGDLMADVGNRVGMKYGAEGSGANPSPDAFSQYGISSTEGDYNYSTVYSNLQSNKPILITAYANKKRKGIWPFRKTVYSGGHAWVIDGYKRKQKTFTYTYEWVLIKDDRREPLSAYNKYNPYYEEPQDYKNKLLPTDGDVYPGKREVTKSTSTTTYLTMNWGWDGFYDSGEYSISSSSIWRGSGNDYQYKKRILYNFR